MKYRFVRAGLAGVFVQRSENVDIWRSFGEHTHNAGIRAREVRRGGLERRLRIQSCACFRSASQPIRSNRYLRVIR